MRNCVGELRSQLKLSQAAFAARLGVDQATVSRMEKGVLAVDRRTRLAVMHLANLEGIELPADLIEAA